jgi:uncharacterized protein YukE
MPDVAGGNILVDTELGDAGNYVRGRSASISGELTSLKTRLQPILDVAAAVDWQGRGQKSYAPYQEAWNHAALGLFGNADTGQIGVLGAIASQLDHCWINYCNNEAAIVKGWTPGGH